MAVKSWEKTLKDEIALIINEYKGDYKLTKKHIDEIDDIIFQNIWDTINEYIVQTIDEYINENEVKEKE
jgi:hypothetical protein